MMPITRREVLTAGAAALLGQHLLAVDGLSKDSHDRVLVDTHLHCFGGSNNPRFPYHHRAPYRPDEAATPQHLMKCMDGARVQYAIVVHPEPYQDDHRYLEYCLEVGRGRLKGTLLLFADRAGSLEQLPQLAERLDVVSLRVHAYAPDRLPPLGKPELRNLWKQAGEHDLAVQLHFEPRYAPAFEPLIREFRDTLVIIDHLGRPLQGTPAEHAAVVRWSRYSNTIMKLSSLASTRNYPHRNIRPVINQLITAFGAERMVYGGGFSAEATPESYGAAFEHARSYLDHLSQAEQAKILGENAVRLFGFAGS
ncbi:MAG: amidohydrolase family protein [Planctomycetota bacterium]|jgi:predicted TIM-barrel fold metal-dependent hydrolase